MFYQLHKLGRGFGTRNIYLSLPLVAKAAVRSTAVVLLLLIYCFMYAPLFVGALCGLCNGVGCFVSFIAFQS